jgi:class 3 adenylate cyclase/ADP-ribose pyrophosphatase YjhB (NUDIX family)
MSSNIIDALVVFVDARGFTSWAEKVDSFAFIDDFAVKWQELLRTAFPEPIYIKYLGDGAMIIKEIHEKTNQKILKSLLLETVKTISNVGKLFSKLCNDFSKQHGCKIPLLLGWGITKGAIKKVEHDYIGADINKCSRLCGIARPFGIVVDRNDFPDLPKIPESLNIAFLPQKRKLRGINEIEDVWVTREITDKLIIREELKETPEVHIAGDCFKYQNGTYYILLAKRKETRRLYPGLYESCGGQLAYNETFAQGIQRHYRKEFNIDIRVFQDQYSIYYIQQPNEPIIPGIVFMCEYISGEPISENHDPAPQWYSEEEFKNLDASKMIKGIKDEILKFLEVYKRIKGDKK